AVPGVPLAPGAADERAALRCRAEHVLGFGLSVASRGVAGIVGLVAHADLAGAYRVPAHHQRLGKQVTRGPHDAQVVALLAHEVETQPPHPAAAAPAPPGPHDPGA